MQLNDIYDRSILTEGVFKSTTISTLLGMIAKDVKTADCNFDRQTLTINISFELHGERGWISLRPRDLANGREVFLRKLKAAATSELRGTRPERIGDALAATRRIHPNAIKILTNVTELDVVGIDYDGLSHGLD
jgi:hypothetical protein